MASPADFSYLCSMGRVDRKLGARGVTGIARMDPSRVRCFGEGLPSSTGYAATMVVSAYMALPVLESGVFMGHCSRWAI